MEDPTPPRPIGRRAHNRASRAAFKKARERGLIARHQQKLRHLAEREHTEEPTQEGTNS